MNGPYVYELSLVDDFWVVGFYDPQGQWHEEQDCNTREEAAERVARLNGSSPAGGPGNFNGLTPAEAERLALLLEELGEAQQAIGKVLRHGYESTNPLVDNGPTNRHSLIRELGDVLAAASMLCDAGDIDVEEMLRAGDAKRQRVSAFMHHQPVSSGGAA